MKNYLKNELKHLPMIIIVSIIFCGINTLANNHLFSSKDVDYDNSNTHIESTNVGDAIDELFDAANNFTTYDTRLQGVETKVGTGTLNTTAQNLSGAVNELNGKLDGKVDTSAIKNNLTTSSSGYVLDARQGPNLCPYPAYSGAISEVARSTGTAQSYTSTGGWYYAEFSKDDSSHYVKVNGKTTLGKNQWFVFFPVKSGVTITVYGTSDYATLLYKIP